ncbi:MAG TPA: acetyl-CoA carboxylase biotin carboxyl carrier protein [Pseudogracilibacillus sp.]|nr:acetyl-CoA carboxylase biotin carboxyl carrier protein [Pseudogracilibacillus sp.]
MFKVQEIRELIRLIDNSSISEFSYENDGATLSIKKQLEGVQQVVADQTTIQAAPAPVAPVAPAKEETTEVKEVAKQEAVVEEVEAEEDEDLVEIVSPMVGTFYRKPSPESDTYVEIGDSISEDSVVCIVEAMKLFNEIEAETTGEIVKILVEDGELVEYGQPLFKVKQK